MRTGHLGTRPNQVPRLAGGPARRRGAAILELALSMPVLVMLTFGAMEYSQYFFVKNALTGAARNGVRAAILSAATNATVTAAVNQSLTASNIASGNCTVTTSPSDVSTATAGTAVTVTITATWGNVGFCPLPTSMGGIAPSRQLSVASVMMKE